jgi:putative ABC transport system substrate-binding protein
MTTHDRRAVQGVVVLALLVSAPARAQDAPAADKPYAVVIDDDLPVYRTVVTGVGVEALAPVDEYSLGGDATLGAEVLANALKKSPAAIVAVGPKAANAAVKAAPDVPVIFCMVPRVESYKLEGGKRVGVRLERSYRVQLQALKELVPTAGRVGVLYDPRRSAPSMKLAQRAAGEVGLQIVPVQIDKPAAAKDALVRIAGAVDVLWMIADPTVLNLQTFDAMLAFSRDKKVPFFALNARFVERGALLAFSVDYARLGRQVGRIANQLAAGDDKASELSQVAPDGVDIALNLTTAAQVGEPAALYATVLEYAAAHEHAVRVFK